MIKDVLGSTEYALCISPGFFRYYCYIGVLHAMEDMKCLNATHVSGSSAGSMVGGFLASGMKPNEMRDIIFNIKREDMWDMGGMGGLLRGCLFQSLLEKHLPHPKIENCPLPFGTTAYDVLRCRTTLLQNGSMATAIRASCTFPLLFQPVYINWYPHIDGGIFDDCGMMALPGIPSSKFIVNLVCGYERAPTSMPPEQFQDAKLLTLVIDHVPMVTPFSMDTMGPIAYKMAYEATRKALEKNAPLQDLGNNKYLFVINGDTARVGLSASEESVAALGGRDDHYQDKNKVN